MKPQAVKIAPADVVAASICWLARFQANTGNVARQTTYWHPAKCRFCKVAPAELLRLRLEDCDPAILAAFKNLPREVRQARVKEAQEVQWWDQLPEANAS